jgi:hypothetical protein
MVEAGLMTCKHCCYDSSSEWSYAAIVLANGVMGKPYIHCYTDVGASLALGNFVYARDVARNAARSE